MLRTWRGLPQDSSRNEALKNLPDDFSDTGTESHGILTNELAGAFPVLAMTCFSGSFIGHLEHGELDDRIKNIALGRLDQAISAMFDDTSASFSELTSSPPSALRLPLAR